MSIKTLTAAFLAAVSLGSAFTAPVLAQDEFRFSFEPRELESVEARAELLTRLSRAARLECRTVSTYPPHYGGARKECETALVADIVEAIDFAPLQAQLDEAVDGGRARFAARQ